MLELTAIFIAGGAGFRIAGAMIAPGDRTRRDALVLEGRLAARMVAAAVLLLALAGTIEGLLSASDAPAPYKYAASAASAVFLFLYLGMGRTTCGLQVQILKYLAHPARQRLDLPQARHHLRAELVGGKEHDLRFGEHGGERVGQVMP